MQHVGPSGVYLRAGRRGQSGLATSQPRLGQEPRPTNRTGTSEDHEKKAPPEPSPNRVRRPW
eukprot:5166330-Pyramimonas_sp.AAC.1